MAEEKILIINLRKKLVKTPKCERSKSFMKILRKILKKKTKTDRLKIDKKLNEKVWSRGIVNTPMKLRIRVKELDDGSVRVELME